MKRNPLEYLIKAGRLRGMREPLSTQDVIAAIRVHDALSREGKLRGGQASPDRVVNPPKNQSYPPDKLSFDVLWAKHLLTTSPFSVPEAKHHELKLAVERIEELERGLVGDVVDSLRADLARVKKERDTYERDLRKLKEMLA